MNSYSFVWWLNFAGESNPTIRKKVCRRSSPIREDRFARDLPTSLLQSFHDWISPHPYNIIAHYDTVFHASVAILHCCPPLQSSITILYHIVKRYKVVEKSPHLPQPDPTSSIYFLFT
ncbi:hypothetical protein ACMFMG_002435 [Clarireedia jacksonii]